MEAVTSTPCHRPGGEPSRLLSTTTLAGVCVDARQPGGSFFSRGGAAAALLAQSSFDSFNPLISLSWCSLESASSASSHWCGLKPVCWP